jgi:hypothetical protein
LCCRLCSLTLSRLVVLKPLGSDLSSIIIAVKMQVIHRRGQQTAAHITPFLWVRRRNSAVIQMRLYVALSVVHSSVASFRTSVSTRWPVVRTSNHIFPYMFCLSLNIAVPFRTGSVFCYLLPRTPLNKLNAKCEPSHGAHALWCEWPAASLFTFVSALWDAQLLIGQ